MNTPKRILTRLAAIAATAAALSAPAAAQEYPSGTVTLVAPYPPGGMIDMIARLIQPKLEAELGETVVVENKPGAGGMVGSGAVFRSNPDGLTMVLTTDAVMSLNPLIFKDADYDPTTDALPVMTVTESELALAVKPDFPASTLEELVALAAERGGLTYGSSGAPQQILGAILAKETGADLVYIPYSGVANVLNDVMGGHIDIGIGTLPSLMPHVEAGNLKVLLTTGETRHTAFPDVPTVSESLPDVAALAWTAIALPAGTPDDVVAKLTAALDKVMADPEVVERIKVTNQTQIASDPEEARARMLRDMERWKDFLSRVDISFE